VKYFFTILALLLINKSINSQTVGLVLSGGGAKGLAHIGVIKALEENGIPIDYISGTSMGAIVGALYASGYTPDEMVEKFKSKEFSNWSTGVLDDDQRYTVNENFEDASILNFDLKRDSTFIKPILPSHIIPTQQMDLAFLELFTSASALSKANFDSLFIPFRCVASDIQNKKQVVFRNGNLGEAVRASMTIPLYFKPLIIDGKMLFDGGIYNNFPWKELKTDFNPGYIIGSKVASNAKPPKEDDVLLQLENMIVGQTDYVIKDSTSTVIQTVLKDVTLMDFSKVDYIVEEGYLNTLKQIDSIKANINQRRTLEYINSKRREFKKKLPHLKFCSVNFTGIQSKQKGYIERIVRNNSKKSKEIDLQDIYYRLITDEFVKRLYPTAVYDETSGCFDVGFKSEVKKNIEVWLGGNISSSNINQGFISASYYFIGNTANKVYTNIYFGRLYSSVNLSFRKRMPYKLPLSLETSLIFNRIDYYRSASELFFEDVKPAYIIKNEAYGKMEFYLPLSKSIMFTNTVAFGTVENEYYQIDNFSHLDTPDKTFFTFVNNSVKLEKITLNKKQYAYRGRKVFLKLNFIDGFEEHIPGTTSPDVSKSSSNHYWVNVKFYNESYHRIISNRFWLGFLFEANYSNKPFFNNSTTTLLVTPNFSPTPHSKTLFLKNLRADKYFALGLMPNIRLSKELMFRIEGYSYQPVKELLIDSKPTEIFSSAFKSIKFLGSVSLVLHTPVGPLSLSLNYYPNEVKEYFVIFNYGFIMFNRRALE
jgi:NTE family protein